MAPQAQACVLLAIFPLTTRNEDLGLRFYGLHGVVVVVVVVVAVVVVVVVVVVVAVEVVVVVVVVAVVGKPACSKAIQKLQIPRTDTVACVITGYLHEGS